MSGPSIHTSVGLVTIVCCALFTLAWAFECAPPIKLPNAPSLPSIPGDSYQATIEITSLVDSTTRTVEEYLDYLGNRVAKVIYEDSTTRKYVYSYQTDEIFDIQEGVCKVVNMSSPAAKPYLEGATYRTIPNDPSDPRHVFGAAATFKYVGDYSTDLYAGTATVRGIPAHKWSTCQTSGSTAKTEITFYFNVANWTMEIPNLSLPLRIELEGITANSSSSGSQYFHEVHDFINYQPLTLVDPTFFETPAGVVCSGRENTKPLPGFGKTFQYTAEEISPTSQLVQHFSVWYDELSMLVRIDKRDPHPNPPLYTLDPVTEIHDYNTGVRYIKDKSQGNCSIHPLSNASPDAKTNPQKTIQMSDPNRFFSFTSNYVYSGQRTSRGIVCDVYSADIDDYEIDGVKTKATFHYYFLAAQWKDLPLQDVSTSKRYPLHLEIELPKVPLSYANKVVNFFDFDESEPNFDVYDVSDCFDIQNKINFKITFPGKYYPVTENEWKYFLPVHLAEKIKVSPLRIGNLNVNADLHNVYVTGSLLGTSAIAQFQLSQHRSPQRVIEKVYSGVKLPEHCADICIKNPDFLCQGFQYCPDDGFSCGVVRNHTLTQAVKPKGTQCDFFTRTVVKSSITEPTVGEAYDALKETVDKGNLHLLITNPDNYMADFIAISVQEVSGFDSKTKAMPSLSSQFSYRIETVIPSYRQASDAYVWYDQDLQLVRMDHRSGNSAQSNEITTIHDFNLGISYDIDQVTGQCQLTPIRVTDGDFDVNSFASKADKEGGLHVKMKSPLEIFFIDNTYKYIGQKTIRGILCDGFQSIRSDFHIKQFNLTSETSFFTVYFQAEEWSYLTANSLDVTKSQPVQVSIEDKTAKMALLYNYFDFDDEHHTFSYFDVSSCYSADESKSFEIIFKNQPYHPFLDETEVTFLNTGVLKMGEITMTSPLHFQKVSVSYDDSDVYLLVTALGTVPSQYLFQPTVNVSLNPADPKVAVSSYQDCAAACVNAEGSLCQSFDYCPLKVSPVCSLRYTRDENSTDVIVPSGFCTHYSLSELGNIPRKSVDDLYTTITDSVYDNNFKITIFLQGGTPKTYTATDIRDDILRPSDPASLLKKFSTNAKVKLSKKDIVEVHPKVSITECASTCVTSTSLHCQTFDFDFNIGTCRLSNKHLDEMATPLQKDNNINTYTLFYTGDYNQQGGSVFSDKPDKSISRVVSSELCAKQCDEESGFKCESFEYCPDQKTCNLRKTHELPKDQPHPGVTPTCTHFSRNHLFDYTKHSNTVLPGHDDFLIFVDSDSECAKLCAIGMTSCASFEFCSKGRGETQCRLSSADPTTQPSLKTKRTTECDLYTRANKRIIPPASTSTQTSSSSSTGTELGIAFGTLFLGLLLGVAGTVLFSKFWERRKMSRMDDHHQLSDY